MSKRPSTPAPTEVQPQKKKRFQLKAKSFCLTYACPKNLDEHPLTREIIAQHFSTVYPEFFIVVVAEESHKSGKKHYHAYIQIPSNGQPFRSTNPRVFDIAGIHCNIAKRKDGNTKYQKSDFLSYIMKEDEEPVEINIDVKHFLAQTAKKQESKVAIVARDIYHNGLDLKKLSESDVARSIVLMHKQKLIAFDDCCKEIKRQESLIEMKRLEINPGWPPVLQRIAKWYNYRLVDGKFMKCISGLWLYSKKKNRMKSTLLHVLTHLANGSKNDLWTVSGDKGWQEKFRTYWRLLPVDALSGPYISFAQLEMLGSGCAIIIPQRNMRGGHNRYQGPVMITSNSPIGTIYGELKRDETPRYDTEVLTARFLQIGLGDIYCKPLIDALIELHDLDPEEFFKKEEPEDWMSDLVARPGPVKAWNGLQQVLLTSYKKNNKNPFSIS